MSRYGPALLWLLVVLTLAAPGELVPRVWVADRGDGTYRNPIIHADYSDPDVVRVADDYYMTASSFTCAPGLPILHSKDLVNWELIGHALPRQVPEDVFAAPQHGKGCWAPAIRHHDGKFWIYYPDPDYGLYVVTARDPAGEWSRPVLVKAGRGLGDTDVNGPHQGAWVITQTGEHWFFHFQDKGPYGRVVHLEPMTWRPDGWPVMGADPDGDGTGEPVETFRKPDVGRRHPIAVPATSDEFDAPRLGLQWQWQANPRDEWLSLSAAPGTLRLFSRPAAAPGTIWSVPHLLLQKWPAPEFVVTTSLAFAPAVEGEAAGLVIFGRDYAWLGLQRTDTSLRLTLRRAVDADTGGVEQEVAGLAVRQPNVQLRVAIAAGGRCRFSYSMDGRTFTSIGGEFAARPGVWIGAKVGLFAIVPPGTARSGHADWAWFRVGPPANHPF